MSIVDMTIMDLFLLLRLFEGGSMPHPSREGQQPLTLTPAFFHILLALAGKERHGYAIMQEVAASTQGKMRLGNGTLYRSLKQMLEAGLIEESGLRPDPVLGGERRRYYRLTNVGHQAAQAEAERLAVLVRLAEERHLLAYPTSGTL
jgi:DNA-binding PadR family transcriptional regulator